MILTATNSRASATALSAQSLLADDLAMTQERKRKSIVWCKSCRRPDAAIYLTDGNHYCWDCAQRLHRTRGLEAAGKRPEDVHPWAESSTAP